MRKCLFVFSIDTEEEWDWEGPFPGREVSVKNIQQLPQFQNMLNQLGIQATYFLDYAVIDDQNAKQTLQHLKANHPDIEYGAHLHPWVTPPKTSTESEADSHIVNLPIATVTEQISTLTTAITEAFEIQPTSFRSGRWGINNNILNALIDQGYTVDSSVYPYYKNRWFSCQHNSSQPFWQYPDPSSSERAIFELPVTVGFSRNNFERYNRLHETLEQAPWRYFHPIGALWKSNLLRKTYLSPELSTSEDMITLCDKALENDFPVIHMYMHSSSLLPGISQYVKDIGDKDTLFRRIKRVVNHLHQRCDLQMCTITDAANQLTDTIPANK